MADKAAARERWRTPTTAITIPDTGDTFRVLLPTKFNRAYQRAKDAAVAKIPGLTLDRLISIAEGRSSDVPMSAVVAMKAGKLDAFLEHCIIEYPEGLGPDDLAGDFFRMLSYLFERATALAELEDDKAEETAKKSAA